ncbi:MFS general substrate transporter [Dichomitus squalens]|uniref:MFS general substrate transporter n=1 Tax=Dichomitus squalens TaxID=114155 RepID=A0A4Q9P1G3_9APHY|nr:MFS general substrate transporter [Dichomitus squalens]TBU46502.1 MFS general substrate transporter [Dichomitus squalens]
MKPADDSQPPAVVRKKGVVFWLIFLSICVALFLSALELTAVSTALPTIAHDLHASDFVWVGSAYALSSTAFLPMSGGIAQMFGRRPALLGALALFALGSGICGGASSMTMLIAGRTVQGLGGGGIQSLSSIIVADLVTLQERGLYAGLFGLTWSIAGVIGPVVGGSLANEGQWRWLFYLNLPICGAAAICTQLFLKLPTPPGTFSEKMKRLDWIGNTLIIGGTTAVTIALTWGGVTAPWHSAQVLVPLIIGLVLLVLFMLWEARWASHPLVPISLLSNRTSLSGYIQTFFISVVALAVVYYLPTYFQGCKDASPIKSGVMLLGLATLAPAALLAGVIVNRSHRYRPQMWFGWCLVLLGLGLLTTLKAQDGVSRAIGFSVLVGVGIGSLYSTVIFPVQAPLPVSQNARALAFLQFLRSFAGVWGVTIGATVLQNELQQRVSPSFLENFPQGVGIAYAIIPQIPSLPGPLKSDIHGAFAGSLQVVWQVLIGIAGIGFISSLFMEGLPLHAALDEEWTLGNQEATEKKRDPEDVSLPEIRAANL